MSKLFIVSGPSGVGKGTLMRFILDKYEEKGIFFSVSATTRAPRPGEVDGKHYKLVHASPLENWERNEDPRYLNPTHFTVWYRIKADDPMPEGCTVLFGHTPTRHFQDTRPMEPWYGENRIGIDCGCAYPETGPDSDWGRLACLRLEDGKVFYAQN